MNLNETVKIRNKDITISYHRNGITCFTIVGTQLHKKMYIGYTVAEARQDFKEEANAMLKSPVPLFL